MKQTADNNAILRYSSLIECGDIVACKKIRTVYKILAERVVHGYKTWFFDEDRANHIIYFFEKYLRHAEGKMRGQLVKLETHQKAKLAAGWGFVDEEGRRQFQRIVNIVGKKNGKSFESSGIGLYGLMADGEGGANVFSVATKKDQAKLIWNVAKSMRNQAPALKSRTRVTVSGIYFDAMDARFEPLASDSNSLDGLNIHYALLDEIQQWRNGHALYDILARGISARTQPMMMITTTAGTVRGDIYDDLYNEMEILINKIKAGEENIDDRTLPIIYELDDKSEWSDPAMWVKANPNLGVSKSIEYLANEVRKAQENPKLLKSLLTKDFDIPESEVSTWLDWEEINNETTFEFVGDEMIITEKNGATQTRPKPDYCIGGFDLSVRGDLTAAVIVFAFHDDPNLYVVPHFWTPETTIERKRQEEKQPYDKWLERGFLTVCPGDQNDYHMVAKWFYDWYEKYDIYFTKIGYDPAYAGYLVEELGSLLGTSILQPVRQGALTLGMPMATIHKMFQSKNIVYQNHPIMKYNLMCVKVKEDSNGNLLPVKQHKNTQRIDGFMALLCAWTALQENLEEYQNVQG